MKYVSENTAAAQSCPRCPRIHMQSLLGDDAERQTTINTTVHSRDILVSSTNTNNDVTMDYYANAQRK